MNEGRTSNFKHGNEDAAGSAKPKRLNCPDAETWILFASGLIEQADHALLLVHAANCSSCADRLRSLLIASPRDQTNGEEQAVFVLPAIAVEKNRTQLATRMGRERPVVRIWWKPLAAIALIGLGIGTGIVVRNALRPPLRQLAFAYAAARSLELQVPGAPWAPLSVTRGGAAALSNLPPALLESETEIQKHLKRKPEDPEWLHAEGRAALLVWDFETAIKSFQMASDLGARSADFSVDFASAYFERAERTRSQVDYARAIEKLGQALERNPSEISALFNRAIIRAKLYQYDLAIADFEEYIRRAPNAGWRDEAKQRLADLRKRRARVFTRQPTEPPDLRSELLLENAMTSGIRVYSRSNWHALDAEAKTMYAEHGDPWLMQVMRLRGGSKLLRAIDALSAMAALRTVAAGDYSTLGAQVEFINSIQLPKPLRIWRDYELLYHRTRTLGVANCLDTTDLREASQSFPWFEAQVLLESSLCAAGRQDFAAAAAAVDEAARIAQAHNLRATLIRVPNFRGQRMVETGFYSEAFQTATEALATLEGGGFPLRRSYDFHVIILAAATQLALPNTAYGAASMMAKVSRAAGTHMFEMIALCQQAQFALALGRKDEAARAYETATAVYSDLGGSGDAAVYWAVARTGWLAMHHQREGLYDMLHVAIAGRSDGPNLYFVHTIIASLCDLELQAGHYPAVISLAESFWREVMRAVSSNARDVRTYRSDIESVSVSLAYAQLLTGKVGTALASWERFLALDRQLLGQIGETQSAVLDGSAAATLTVANLQGQVGLWTRREGRVKFQWGKGSYSELLQQVRLLRRLSSLPAAPETRIAAEADVLYGMLFPTGTEGAHHIYIQAKGELNAIPLSTFFYSRKGQDSTFSYIPVGVDVLPGTPKLDRVTVIAATVFDADLAGPSTVLPSIEKETDAAGAAFQTRSLLSGRDVTRRAVEEAVEYSGVVHFAGHAVPWHGHIGLAVAPDASDPTSDGRAGIWDMARPRPIKPNLFVFSACRSGEFDEPGSVRPGQLPEAALLAGAGEAIAALWDVDSAATAVWMKCFYEQLSAGQTASAAVRAASSRVRSHEEWRHPHYWAAFVDYARSISEN